MKLILAWLLALLTSATANLRASDPTPPAPLPWLTSLPEAQTLAKRHKKPILLLFTGSDWCSWCKRLQKEVLASPIFQSFARDQLILVEIDFPRLKPMQLEQHQANLALADRFGIVGLPTLVLLNDRGEKIGEFGFPSGGAESLVSRMLSALAAPTPPRS